MKVKLKRFLILAIQVGASIDIEELCISFEVANSVVDSSIIGNPALEPTIDDVGDQSISCCSVCFYVGLCGNVSPDHDVVARWLWLLLRHPEPQRRLEGCCWVLSNYLRVFQAVKSQCLPRWSIVVVPARGSISFRVYNF